MRDHDTNTPDQAAQSARLDTYATDDRDHDEPGPPNLTEQAHAETCEDEDCERILCVLARVVAEQREAREAERVRAEVVRERGEEWWAS